MKKAILISVAVCLLLAAAAPFLPQSWFPGPGGSHVAMAAAPVFRVANQNTDFTTAAGWDSVSNTPTLGTGTIQITGSSFYSVAFTAPNTTNASTGCIVMPNAIGTGTFVFSLEEYDGAAWQNKGASGATASIALASLSGYTNTYLYFRWTTPYTYTTTSAGYYRIKSTITTSGGTTTLLQDSGGSNFMYMATDDRHVAPATTDSIVVCGYNRTNTVAVTVAGTQTCGNFISNEPATSVSISNGVEIGSDGELKWDTAANSSLTCNGNFVVGSKGTWTMSQSDMTKTMTLIIGQDSSTTQYGIAFENSPTSVSLQGAAKTSTSLWKTHYSSGSGTVGSPLITADAVDWSVGDEIIVAATSNSATNYQESEGMVVATKNSSTSYVLTSINQLFTGDMESRQTTGVTSTPFNYWSGGGTTANLSADATCHSGALALKCARTTSSSYVMQDLYYNNPRACENPNQSVTLDFWTRGDGTYGGRYGIYDVTNSAWITGPTATGVTGTTYTEVTKTVSIPANCSRYRVQLESPTTNSSSCYYDDVTLTYSGLTYTHTTDAYILNVTRNVIVQSNMNSRGYYLNNLSRTAGAVDIDWTLFRWEGQSGSSRPSGIALASGTPTYRSGSTSTQVSSTSSAQTWDCDYSVCYESRYSGFYYSMSTTASTNSGLITCISQAGSSLGIDCGTRNTTLEDCFVIKCALAGMRMAGYNNTYNRCCVISCDLTRPTSDGAMYVSSTGGGSKIAATACEVHASGYGLSVRGQDTGFMRDCLIGTKGHNDEADIYMNSSYIDAVFMDNCTYGSSTLVANYLNSSDGSLVRIQTMNGEQMRNEWITNFGIGYATGTSLPDTTSYDGGYGMKMTSEDSTDGMSWSFLVLSDSSDNTTEVNGFLNRDSACTVTVDLYLSGSSTPDDTYTFPGGDIGVWDEFYLSAPYTENISTFATVTVTMKCAAGPALYVDEIFNGANTICGLDAWYDGMPSALMYARGVMYTPVVVTEPATCIGTTTASLWANVTDDGNSFMSELAFWWDTVTGPPYANEWYESGNYLGEGEYSYDVTGLTEGTLYYEMAWAANQLTTGYGAEATFLTKPVEPDSLIATTVSDTEIGLTWNKGTGAQKTMIRGKTGSVPTGVADGDQVYFDTGTSCSDSGLSSGEHRYYRAWSYVTAGGLTQYSDVSVIDSATTGPTLSVPAVTTQPAEDVEQTTAMLVGLVTDNGNLSITTRGFQYDVDSGAPYANDWHEHGDFGAGTWYGPVTGLAEGTTVYYRAYATNSEGTSYGSEVAFLTKPDAPSDLLATPTTAVLYTLTWTKGDWAQTTIVRGKVGSYPTDVADGSAVYSGAGAGCTHAVAGEHWYYRAWSFVDDGVRTQYSDGSAMDSCVYVAPCPPAPPIPGPPTGFTATYNDDNVTVYLSWTMGVDNATQTLIQASLTGYPASPTEGETVYFGPADNCTDSLSWASVEAGAPIYYSAWSYNISGFSATYATATTDGGGGMAHAMLLGVLMVILIFASVFGDWKRFWPLIIVASIGWFLTGGWAIYLSLTTYDGYWVAAVLCVGIAIATFFWPFVMKPAGKDAPAEPDEEEEAWGGRRHGRRRELE